MAVIEYSDYVEGRDSTTPAGIDLIAIVQGGEAFKITVGQLQTLIGNFVDEETPAGDIDDVNDTFILANNPLASSVKVYQNGVRLKATEDYTISGDTITFLTPPTTGDIILVDYRI